MPQVSISTHVLDLDSGKPAEGIEVTLNGPGVGNSASAQTDSDGRIKQWSSDLTQEVGEYELVFEVGAWFEARGKQNFYPRIQIAFRVEHPDEHYHVPLLMNAYGYSTYRGS